MRAFKEIVSLSLVVAFSVTAMFGQSAHFDVAGMGQERADGVGVSGLDRLQQPAVRRHVLPDARYLIDPRLELAPASRPAPAQRSCTWFGVTTCPTPFVG